MHPALQLLLCFIVFMVLHISVMAACARLFGITVRSISYGVGPTLLTWGKVHLKLLPLAVGDATPAEVAQVLDVLWGGEETLIVISSDLSHFLPYTTAQTVDRDTVQTMLNLQTNLNHQQACGATPVNGMLLAARRHQLQPRLLGLCNSGDTAGDKGRVVGYASLAFTPGASHAH